MRKVAVGTVKKSINAHWDRCVRRNVRQVGEGDARRRPRYLATVVSAIAIPQLLEFAVNSWRAPQGIGAPHLLDQCSDIEGDGRAPETRARRPPSPVPGEQAATPRDDGGRLHDLHGAAPPAPHA